ncbi:hypothetical protein [Hymenobacter psoromatis]|uniref:hypothetical protein n=1 Tax=Hymenobacter psoromatis TaxID=1484116 RepID=UPI001CC0526F|nr:hypothetical protein [Hymenobacter psoromatis]
MKHSYWLLLALTACEPITPDSQQVSQQVRPRRADKQPTTKVKPTISFTSGDRTTYGPHDTLHVGRGIVLRLELGSKSDFAKVSRSRMPYSEARTMRQEGNGRVYRAGHTLVLNPFNHPALRFPDNTSQIRGDENEVEGISYTFSGSVPGRPYWMVDSLMYEYYHPFLINKYSGRATPLWNTPDISPNRQQILVATPGLDGESSPNGLQLFIISRQSVHYG